MGLFGLGGLEILVIIAGIGVVLGPEKILDMVRSSGDTAEDYKRELSKVPDEFKKGMEEGEIEARSRKAKVIRKVVVKDKQDEWADNNESTGQSRATSLFWIDC